MRNGFYLGLTLPLLLAMAVNAYGLTTFGKSQTNNQQAPNPPPQVPRGRECTYEKDCTAAIANTSCVPDPQEPKVTRCLCGDNKSPVNGACKSKHKGVYHACMASEECIYGSECMPYTEGGNRGVDKTCKCKEGFTFSELEFLCNGAVKNSNLSFPLLTALASVLLAFTSFTN